MSNKKRLKRFTSTVKFGIIKIVKKEVKKWRKTSKNPLGVMK